MAVTVRDVVIRVRVENAGVSGFGAAGGGSPLLGPGQPVSGGGGGRAGGRSRALPTAPTAIPGIATRTTLSQQRLAKALSDSTRAAQGFSKTVGGATLELINLATWSRAITRTTFAIRGAGLVGAVPGLALGFGAAAALAANVPASRRFIRGGGVGRFVRSGIEGLQQGAEAFGGGLFETENNRRANINAPAFIRGRIEQRFIQQDRITQQQLDRISAQQRLSQARIQGAGALAGFTGGGAQSVLSTIEDRLFLARGAALGAVTPGGRLGASSAISGLSQQRLQAVSQLGQEQVGIERQKLQFLRQQLDVERQKAATLRESVAGSAERLLNLTPGQARSRLEALRSFRQTGVIPQTQRGLERLGEAVRLGTPRDLREFQEAVTERVRRDPIRGEILRPAEQLGQAEQRVRDREEAVREQIGELTSANQEAARLLRQAADALERDVQAENRARDRAGQAARDEQAARQAAGI